MTNLKEKVAYLQGLTKGLSLSDQSAEGKLLINIVKTLDSFAEEFNSLSVAHQDLEDYVETLDEDLTDVEEEVFEDTENEYVEMECPDCHETVTFDADLLNDDEALEVTCPNCGEIVYENTFSESRPSSAVSVRSGHPGL